MNNTFTPQETDLIYQLLENINDNIELSVLFLELEPGTYGPLFNSVCKKLENYTMFTSFSLGEIDVILDALQLGLGFDWHEIRCVAHSAYKKAQAIRSALQSNCQ